MSGREFLDTNVLLYSLNDSAQVKHKVAQGLVTRALAGEFVISTQVLAELAVVVLKKFVDRISPRDLVAFLDTLAPIPVIKPDAEIVRRAVQAHAAYQIGFYDAMIVAAAERAGSGRILSEDLNAGQEYFGIKVMNPF